MVQSQIVDPSMGRIVLRLPVELFEKVGAGDRQFALVPCGPAAHGVRKREGEDQGGKGEMGESAHGDSGSRGGEGIITCCEARME